MKAAFVTPRYGLNVTGGAELAARQLAERLAADTGWSTEVFTTCAVDHITWQDVFPAGDSLINRVVVHRIPSLAGRDPAFFGLDGRLRVAPQAATPREGREWVVLQGPHSPALVEALGDSGADVAVFYPYLYYPTVAAIGRVPMPTVLHPAAHDEPAIYLPVFRPTFRAADAFVYHTRSERELVESLFPVASRPQLLLGLGVDPPGERPPGRPEVAGLDDRPYVVCFGRVDAHKGSLMLGEYFATYKRRNPGPLALVYAGHVNDEPPDHPDIVVAGPVSEEDKWRILAGARALVSPSAFESFSLVAAESLAVSVPVLVNGACGPTRELCRRSGAGLWFDSFQSFEAALHRLVGDDELRVRLGRRGARYVADHLEWSTLIARYGEFLARVAERGRRPSPIRSQAW